jgi:NADH:ubiquinone oxidoreductase subunit F (NADH-binding)
VARHIDPDRWRLAMAQKTRLHCLGKCHIAPAGAADADLPRVEVFAREPIALGRLVKGGAPTLKAYQALGGYTALPRALEISPDRVVAEIERSALRGRGGAGFPAGRKWRAVLEQGSPHKYVVANGDEGDPGAYIDRFLMEEDPHAIIEAMAIAGVALGARRGLIYVRAEYPTAVRRLDAAIAEARANHLLGDRVLGSPLAFDIQVIRGHGSYLCGEETALLNALEGKRPEVRARPPYPASHGVFGHPTLVHNIETLVNVPWIVERGGDAYAAFGHSTSRGTKVVSLNSLFRRPGLYEIELGMPVRQVVDDLGGGVATGALKGVLIGGPLAGVIPPSLLQTPLAFEELRAIGASVGHGGIVAIDEHTTIRELVHHVFAFGAAESCGKCTPCRLGSRNVERMFDEARSGPPQVGGRDTWRALTDLLAETSLCGHGTGLGEFAASIERHYGKDLDRCFE